MEPSTRSGQPGPWARGEQRRLRDAFRASGHTQERFAVSLMDDHGHPGVPSQASVSRWLSGRAAPRASSRPALAEYCAEWLPDLDDAADVPAGWEALLRDVSGEPMLGPRQASLIDAMTSRFASGPPLSTDDRSAFLHLARILGLHDD